MQSKKLVIECVEDPYYYGIFGAVANLLVGMNKNHVDLIVIRCVNVGESRSLIHFLKYRILNPVLSRKWINLYRVFSKDIAYKSCGYFELFTGLRDLIRAFSIWRGLNSGSGIADLSVDGVLVGDLINDTYIRFKPSPTVPKEDWYLLFLIWQALLLLRHAKKYFSTNKVSYFLTSYSTYIHHGIPVRVALQLGVRVFAMGNYFESIKQLNLSDHTHTKSGSGYASDFSMLKDQEQKVLEAEMALKQRFSGVVDDGLSYMRKSPYKKGDKAVPDVNGAYIIFLHDFYDSPHVYKNILFPDFYQWVCQTIDVLNKLAIPFFIKPHPNQVHAGEKVMADLTARFPQVRILDSSITNIQLVDAGIIGALTVYGSVAHEMAYMGIPTIACGDNPHSSFTFCLTAKTIKEYFKLIKEVPLMDFDRSLMKQECLQFFYMHYLHNSEDEKELLKLLSRYRLTCNSHDDDDADAGVASLGPIVNSPFLERRLNRGLN
ncbi:hypothetical protein [Polynucleobacter paneuropaeus]|uniref:hypothetical protein n=1 Tax=Polynucleobacter paneuropaeus TaxID=2527775 RepID=UPI001BFEE574|nr:hypothetical protein [Polynucleobacter paneuropaeus]MBT8621886.1 hypothetical protein [Polynucleobacter paneuropaeus]